MAEATRSPLPPYGVAIADALGNPSTTLEELVAHRDHAREVLSAQGDLRAALERLDGEIARRGGR